RGGPGENTAGRADRGAGGRTWVQTESQRVRRAIRIRRQVRDDQGCALDDGTVGHRRELRRIIPGRKKQIGQVRRGRRLAKERSDAKNLLERAQRGTVRV